MARVLLITYYFPPAGGAPVQRVLKFARYLPSFSWSPTVLTVSGGAFSSRDEGLVAQVPDSVPVIRTTWLDPFGLYGRLTGKTAEQAVTVGFISDRAPDWREHLARWLRANVFIPDARIGWVPFAVKAAKKLIVDDPPEAIVSSGPPHSVHLIARKLHRHFGVPWIADFRDPWTEVDYAESLPTAWWSRRLNARLERSVLREAALVTTISPSIGELMRKAEPSANIRVIYNGYDPSDLPEPRPADPDRFWIAYAGSMNRERNPEALWRSLRFLLDRGEASEMGILLIGSIDRFVLERIESYGLSGRVQHIPALSYRETLMRLLDAALLLVVVNRVGTAGQRGIMPTKAYEYMGLRRPVLAVGPPDGDLAGVLASTETGRMVDYEDQEGLMTAVREAHRRWRAGERALRAGNESVEAFSRQEGTRQLAAFLDELTGRQVPSGVEGDRG